MKTEEIEAKIRKTKHLDMNMVTENTAPSFQNYLQELLEKTGTKRAELIKALNVDHNYGYQMLNGTRTPTRVKIIRIALFMQLDVKSTQRLLNLACREALYVCRPEDAKAVHCLEHHTELRASCEFILGE